MGYLIERIDKPLQEKLYEAAFDNIRGSDERHEMFSEYRVKYASRNKDSLGKLKELSYDCLSDFLRASGISVKEMFALGGVGLKWADEKAETMCRLCDGLDEPTLRSLCAIAEDYAPEIRVQTEDIHCVTRKIFRLFRQRVPRYERRGSEVYALIKTAWDDQKGYTTVKTVNLPAVANAMGLSLHWLMGLDGDITVLAERPLTERFMESWLFLPENAKNAFLLAADDLSPARKAEGGRDPWRI